MIEEVALNFHLICYIRLCMTRYEREGPPGYLESWLCGGSIMFVCFWFFWYLVILSVVAGTHYRV